MLDRTLVVVGTVLYSALTLILGINSQANTPEVTNPNQTPIVVVLPLEAINAKELAPEEMPTSKGIPKDQTQRCPQWEAKFREYGLPVVAFSYISFRESRCNPKSWNRYKNADHSTDLGLVQINSSWKTVTRNICGTDITGLFNVDCNLSVAKYLYDNGGLRHWNL